MVQKIIIMTRLAFMRYILIMAVYLSDIISCQHEPYGDNVALKKPAIQSSTYKDNQTSFIASLGVDGNQSTNFYIDKTCSHTNEHQLSAWWTVNLNGFFFIKFIRVYQWIWPDVVNRLNGSNIYVKLENNVWQHIYFNSTSPPAVFDVNVTLDARIGEIMLNNTQLIQNTNETFICICELEVYEVIECSPYIIPKGRFKVVKLGDSRQNFTYGAKLTVTCEEGYHLSEGVVRLQEPESIIECTANKSWSKHLTCSAKRCNKPLPQVSHGLLILQGGIDGIGTYNTTVSLHCLEGYKMDSGGQSRCADDEQWQGSIGLCLVKRCNQPLPQVPHSSHIYMDGIEGNGTYNTTVSLNCHEGYKLVAGGQPRCADDEQWHGSLGFCMVKRCNQSLPHDSHGFITFNGGLEGNGTYNTTVSLNCQEGYKLVGGGQSRCSDNEQWQGSIGLCLGRTLKCFACQDMTHLKYCNLVEQCQEHMGCYLEQFYVGEHIRYNSGCISQDNRVCDMAETVTSQCTRCCNTSYCNSHGCGDNGFEVSGKRGPLCYDCQHLGDPSECLNIQECAEFEICHITEFRWGTHDRLYSMGCQPRHRCISHSVPVNPDHIIVGRSVPMCSVCCAEDFCNLNCTSQ